MVFISGNGSTVAQKMHKRLNRNLGKTAHWKSDRSREMYGHRIKRLSLQLKTLYLSPIENWLLLLVDINATIIEKALQIMIPRGKLYISNSELFTGVFYCVTERMQSQKNTFDYKSHNTLTCLSVRTAFDLVLTCLNFPPGSEILVTDINIPDMFNIIVAHNLTPVPLPINKNTLNMDSEQLESSITAATKAILVTHLFGAVMETEGINTIARKYNLLVIEDCAQAYAGNVYQGNPETDIILFSFGLIKTNTAVRGATMKIKDPILYSDVVNKNEQYDQQQNWQFLKKLIKVV